MDLSGNLIKSCICDNSRAFDSSIMNTLSVLQCKRCSVMHQCVVMTEQEYENYYTLEYDCKHNARQRYDHDLGVAKLRLDCYAGSIPSSGKLLDVGCNNGAFVDAALQAGYDAYGNELNPSIIGDRTYAGYLTSLGLEGSSFNVITLHDVLEHFVDPVANLTEIHRLMSPGGALVVDFPHFFVESGLHHWKPTEHLWLLSAIQLEQLLATCGFTKTKSYEPIPSKMVQIFTKFL